MSAIRLYLPKDLRQKEQRQAAFKSLQQVLLRFPQGPQLLDPQEDMEASEGGGDRGGGGGRGMSG